MKKRICVATATRAEYGLLKPIIKKLKSRDRFTTELVVTGAHLSPEFGYTYHEIEQDGINIDKRIEILLSSDTDTAMSKAMGLALISFGEYFTEHKFDLLIVLGDRYETLSICCAALNAGIPIAHLYGGETTEGAIDESIRHAITKLSYLHFTSTEQYRKRVIQLGEEPERVFNVGAIGIENALQSNLMNKNEVEKNLGLIPGQPYALVTFHPVTLEKGMAEMQAGQLTGALEAFPEIQFIITKANADAEGIRINAQLERFTASCKHAKLFHSLGSQMYLSALKYACMVIGNSSSGLVEAPSFKIPTVNIGYRQKGRLQADGVINCQPDKLQIIASINKALYGEYKKRAEDAINPYGAGNTSDKIISVIEEALLNNNIDLKKKFYDLE